MRNVTLVPPNCTGTGYSAHAEFELHAECDIPVVAHDAIRIFSVVLACLAVVFQIGVLCVRGKSLWHEKKKPFRILLVASPIICAVIVLRPLLGHSAIGPEWRACTSLPMALLANMGTSAGVGFVAYFAFLEAKIVEKSSFGRNDARKPHDFMARHKAPIFGTLGALQAVLFFVGAFVGFYFPVEIGARLGYWIPTLFILLTILPFCIYLGTTVFIRLRRSETQRKAGLQRQLFWTNLSLAALDIVATVLAIIQLIALVDQANFVLVELLWVMSTVFMTLAFVVISRKSLKRKRADNLARQKEPSSAPAAAEAPSASIPPSQLFTTKTIASSRAGDEEESASSAS